MNLKSLFELDFKLVAALGLGVVMNQAVQSQQNSYPGPNIIYIMSDDHAYQAISAYGNYYNPDFINQNGRYREEGYVTEIITKKCIQWINEAKTSGKSFMLPTRVSTLENTDGSISV